MPVINQNQNTTAYGLKVISKGIDEDGSIKNLSLIEGVCNMAGDFLSQADKMTACFIPYGNHVGRTKNGDVSNGTYRPNKRGVDKPVSTVCLPGYMRIPGNYKKIGNGDVTTFYKQIIDFQFLSTTIKALPSFLRVCNSIYIAMESKEDKPLQNLDITQKPQHDERMTAYYKSLIHRLLNANDIEDIELVDLDNEQQVA